MRVNDGCRSCGEYAGSHQPGVVNAFCGCSCHRPLRSIRFPSKGWALSDMPEPRSRPAPRPGR